MAGVKSNLPAEMTSMQNADPPLELISSASPSVLGYLASFAMTAAATVVAIGIDNGLTVPNVSLVFVVPVIIAGVAFGLGPSLAAAVLGALAYNFFLTEPRYSLAVDDPANIWAIGLFFLVGLIVSTIAFTSRRRATEGARLTRQATVLQAYSRDIVATGTAEAAASVTSRALKDLFQVPAVVMLLVKEEVVSMSAAGGLEPQQAEFEAARASLAADIAVRGGQYPALASRFDFWPVITAAGHRAVIGLAFDPGDRPLAPATFAGTVASVLALALDRQPFPAGRDTGSAR